MSQFLESIPRASDLSDWFWVLLAILTIKVCYMYAMLRYAGRSKHLRGNRPTAYWRNPKDATGDQKLKQWHALRHGPSPLYPEQEARVIILSEIEQRQSTMSLAITLSL